MSYPPPSDPNQQQPPQYGQQPPQYSQQPPQYAQQGYGQPPIQQPVRKSKSGLIIGIVLGVVLLVCLVCGGGAWYFFYQADKAVDEIVDNFPTVFPTDASDGTPHTVVYEINGSGKALITWARGGGGTDSETADLPWRKELTVNRSSFGLTVFAFPRDGGTADSCKITVDGQERTAKQGQSGLVTCTATIVN